jgi:hypothetical protein
MPAKTKKVKAAGVSIVADGRVLSRLQSVTMDTDLGIEEIREIASSEITEFVEGIPTVSISMEANQWGKRNNIVAISAVDGTRQAEMIAGATWNNSLNHKSFDGTSVDLVAQVEEDGVLKRSVYVGDAFVTALSWNFDVGGVATESYTLEADNKVWYMNTQKEIVVCSGNGPYLTSGVQYSSNYGSGYFSTSGFAYDGGSEFSPLFVTVNGTKVTDASGNVVVPSGIGNDSYVTLYAGPTSTSTIESQLASDGRYRIVGFKNTANTTISHGSTDTPTGGIGGIRKGMIKIFLTSGAVTGFPDDATEQTRFLRLQTCSIDADLSREALEELGNFKAYDRSLTFPILRPGLDLPIRRKDTSWKV